MRIAKVMCVFVVGCITMGYTTASDRVVFDLDSSLCGGSKLGCKWTNGYKTSADCFDNVDELASNIKRITSGKMSANSGSVEFLMDSGSYKINGGNRTPVLFKLRGVESDPTLGGIVFNGTVEKPTAVELGFNNNYDMHLNVVECNNIPLFKVNIGGTNSGGYTSGGYIKEFKTNTKTGLSYNKQISIDGILCNNVGRDICMIANRGTNNIINACNNSCHMLGGKYEDFGWLSEVTKAQGYRIVDIKLLNMKRPVTASAAVCGTPDGSLSAPKEHMDFMLQRMNHVKQNSVTINVDSPILIENGLGGLFEKGKNGWNDSVQAVEISLEKR